METTATTCEPTCQKVTGDCSYCTCGGETAGTHPTTMDRFRDKPGPWKWRRVYGGGGLVALLLEATLPQAHNDPVVLAVREDWMGHLDRYDAQTLALIAAAPAMRAALREIADLCDGPAATRAELAHAIKESARQALAVSVDRSVCGRCHGRAPVGDCAVCNAYMNEGGA